MVLAQLQSELVGVQSSLFSLGLELEASQRRLRQSQRQGDDLVRLKDRLNSDLQEVLQHREVTEKHNQVSAFCKYERSSQTKRNKASSRICSVSYRTCAALFTKVAQNSRLRRQRLRTARQRDAQ